MSEAHHTIKRDKLNCLHAAPRTQPHCPEQQEDLFGRHNLGGQLGCTMVLHTWDQTLGAHFHVHCVIPAGALAPDGERWIAADPRLLFPVRALSMVFRGKFLDALTQACTKGALTFTGTIAALGTPQGFATLNEQLRSKDWVVYTKKPFGHIFPPPFSRIPLKTKGLV